MSAAGRRAPGNNRRCRLPAGRTRRRAWGNSAGQVPRRNRAAQSSHCARRPATIWSPRRWCACPGRLRWFQGCPDAARQINRALAAGFVDRRDEHLVAQHELIGVARAFRIFRELQGERVPGGVAVVADLQRVNVEETCQLFAEIAEAHRAGRHLGNQGTQLAGAHDQFRRRVGIGREIEFRRQHRRHGGMHHPQEGSAQRAP